MARRGAKSTITTQRRKTPAGASRAKSIAGAAAKSAQRDRDLREALEREAAAAEVLRVIAQSPGDLDAVFRVMLENATRLCEAKFGTLFRYDGEKIHRIAGLGTPKSLTEFQRKRGPFAPDMSGHMYEAIRKKRAIMSKDEAAIAKPGVAARHGGARSTLYVPMIKDDHVVGMFVIYRQEVRPFTDRQIELVKNFAAQAVIAIENTRLLNELRQRTGDLTESLEQQTATSEVLKVISSSPGELDPVFQAMLANALRICEAKFGSLFQFDGEKFHPRALLGAPPAYEEFHRRRGAFVPPPGTPLQELLQTGETVHTVDVSVERVSVEFRRYAGTKSHMAVPMLRDGNLVGAIVIYRQEVRPFTGKQIELVQNFAAQAVIAIENTRLLSELRESLQQQTATSEVLSVISRSPGELEPVFQAMLENATRICEAKFGNLLLYDGDAFRAAAFKNAPQAYVDLYDKGPVRPGPHTGLGRLARAKRVVHIEDIMTGQAYDERDPLRMATANILNARTFLAVPMLKDENLVGAIIIYRQEVRPFSDKQIELVTNFAAQAVIAIENTRLLSELRQRTNDLTESLQQQTATSEVLKVISSSPGELEPVFQAMLENATRICEAGFGILFLSSGDAYRTTAMHNAPPALIEARRSEPLFRPAPHTTLGQMHQSRRAVQVADMLAQQGYFDAPPGYSTPQIAMVAGARTVVAVPMLKDDELVGAIVIYRQEVRPFSDKQVELVTTFAAQAVIAIENARLLSEIRESLQQQTATADVLKVISRSTFDLQAVLDTLVESAGRLCGSERVGIRLARDGRYHHVASHGFPDAHLEYMRSHPLIPDRSSVAGRAVIERRSIHVVDMQADAELSPTMQLALNYPVRTILGVPLLREGGPIGVLLVMRAVVEPFTDKQIELAETFADQAVIAIENVRLFDEIQDKSRQLAEASEHKSQFLANMSHELRTPLNAILGYTELIVDGVYGAPAERMAAVLKRIESNGRHLLGLINAVLDLSKIEAGQLSLDLADYSFRDVVNTVCTAVEPLAADKKLVLKAEVPRDLPGGRGDERRLTQVLLNLVGNAIKFTDTGEVVVSAKANDGAFSVSVRDTGPGISAADQGKLFQEFQQADNSITRKKGGTGLGLAISKRIIEMHGGKIWLESAPSQGSTFYFTLPVEVRVQAKPN